MEDTTPKEFVENWNLVQTLGEGAYGEVKLLEHTTSHQTIAVKIVDLLRHRDASTCVDKEEKIHRMLIHPNIIRLLGKRVEPNTVYIFLEYAAGGELFDQIEPDIGMCLNDSQKYTRQLLSGVDYLHSKGIAHRDIKPENLLLNDKMNLKICDFGMATIFRLRGKERLLDKRCGTLPYVAPEVLIEPYHAEPADVWSCGIVLVVMLGGELPWDEPTSKCFHFRKWQKEDYLMETPWSKFENTVLSLVKKILTPNPAIRATIKQILQHPWMHETFDGSKSHKTHKRPHLEECDGPTVTLSQPIQSTGIPQPEDMAILLQKPTKQCFSQPTHNEDLILSSQLQFTQSPLTQNNLQRLTKRMTRFFVETSHEKTIKLLCAQLEKYHYTYHNDPSGIITVSTMDNRKTPIVFKANLINMDNKLLLDFRLSKGCGLEFKRIFIKLKIAMKDIIIKNN